MRTSSELLDNKMYKFVINSIISAIDTTKLSDEDKNDITNKLNTVDNTDLSENDDSTDFNVFENDIIKDIVNTADLDYIVDESPKYASFDLAEAMYIFTNEYKGSEYSNIIKEILNKLKFKPSTSLREYDDLDTHGRIFYKTMSLKEKEYSKLKEQKINETKKTLSYILKKVNKNGKQI